MPKNTALKVIVVICIVLAGWVIYQDYLKKETKSVREPFSIHQYLSGKTLRASVIFLDYNVAHDSTDEAIVRKAFDGPAPSGYYSVKSFYAKYQIQVQTTYSVYSVSALTPPRSSMVSYDCDSYGQRPLCMIHSWAREYESQVGSINSTTDMWVFIADTDMVPGELATGAAGFVELGIFADPEVFHTPQNWGGVLAHEMAHLFGAKDHYPPHPAPSGDQNCLMNQMGRKERTLNTDTDFGPTDLNEIHWDYVIKDTEWNLVNL